MLTEIRSARQVKGEPVRRWFADEALDLIVWYADDGGIAGFQLCYREDREEKALTWLKGRGFFHNRVDDGEPAGARHKMTPILVADGAVDKDRVLADFLEAARELDAGIGTFVAERLRAYPRG